MTEQITTTTPRPTSVRTRPRLSRDAQRRLLRVVYHAVGLFPLAWLIFDFWFGFLGPEPIRAMILRTGKAAIIMLMLSLACTPANIIFGWKQAIVVRRALGLYAFMYVCIHLLIFVGLDYGFIDAGDGPAVFIILIAGFIVVGSALAVETISQHTGIQAEQHPRQSLEHGGRGHEQRIAGHRRHEQGAGREGDAIADVAHPRRPEQQGVGRPEPSW